MTENELRKLRTKIYILLGKKSDKPSEKGPLKMNKNHPPPKYYLFLHFNVENHVSLNLFRKLTHSGTLFRPGKTPSLKEKGMDTRLGLGLCGDE